MWSLQEIKDYIGKLDVLSTTLDYQEDITKFNDIGYNILPILIGKNFFGFQIELDILEIENVEAPKLSPLPFNNKSLISFIYLDKPLVGNGSYHYIGYRINSFILDQLPRNVADMIQDICYFGIPNVPIILPGGEEGKYYERNSGFEIPFRYIDRLDKRLYAHGVSTREEHGGLLYIVEYNLGLIKRIITMYQETKKIVLLINIDDYGYTSDIYFNMERSYNDDADTHLYYTFDKDKLLGPAWLYMSDNIYITGINKRSILVFRIVDQIRGSVFICPLYRLYSAFDIQYRPYRNSIGNRELGGIKLFGIYIHHERGNLRYYDYKEDLYGPEVVNKRLVEWYTETNSNPDAEDFYNELSMIIKMLDNHTTHDLTKIVIDYYIGPQFIDYLYGVIGMLPDRDDNITDKSHINEVIKLLK